MRVMITGGAGYVGCRLVPALLADGHDVAVYDTFWFGDHLPGADGGLYQGNGPNGTTLTRYPGDVRQAVLFRDAVRQERPDAVIHLACISNDPSFELDESLSRTINYEAFEPLVVAAKEEGVQRFIYCSTSSVYGISDSPDVREDHPLVPLTLYNTYKAKCEPILLGHASVDFECVVVRPSTVCGYSPRQRLDLAVNILTSQAFFLGKITVLGGKQMRPNLHIEDMVDCYRTLLAAPVHAIQGETFNAGAANASIADIADWVSAAVSRLQDREVPIETFETNDVRSYQVNSDKIAHRLGFVPKYGVSRAIHDLCRAFTSGLVPDAMGRDEYYNVRQMRRVFPELYRGAGPSEMDPNKGVLSEIDLIRSRGALS